MVDYPVQRRERTPSLIKERLIVMAGILIMFFSIPAFFVHFLLGDLIFILGAILSVIYTKKQYNLFKTHQIASKAGIIWTSFVVGAIVIIGTIIVLIINLVKI